VAPVKVEDLASLRLSVELMVLAAKISVEVVILPLPGLPLAVISPYAVVEQA
jgi:hypothetical protein